MATKIIREGTKTYHATCPECGAVFTYEREDVRHNYVRGGDYVHCPSCGHTNRHFGASGNVWPCPHSTAPGKYRCRFSRASRMSN